MSGKAWALMTLFTAISLTLHVYHSQCACTEQDLESHLYDRLLEDHWFEIKEFYPSETNLMKEQHRLLSVINTLCSTYSKNKKKIQQFNVIETFETMITFLSLPNKVEDVCEKLTCTDGYTIRYVNKSTFGAMYEESCNGSISDLKCPSKESTTSPPSSKSPTTDAFEWTRSSTLQINQTTTVYENLQTTFSTTLQQANNQGQQQMQEMQELQINTLIGVLAASLLCNVILLLCGCHWYRNAQSQTNIPVEVKLIQIQEKDNMI